MALETELYTKKMMNLSAERERISTELALATRIQSDMLPDIFSALPDRKEFDVSESMTPGVPKAANADKEIWGMTRMLAALNNNNTTASPQEALKNVSEAVNDFVKGAEQSDDLTMLCLEYKGSLSKK